MSKELVFSAVVDWDKRILTITDPNGVEHPIPLPDCVVDEESLQSLVDHIIRQSIESAGKKIVESWSYKIGGEA